MKQKHNGCMHALSGVESSDIMTSRGGSDAGRATAFSIPFSVPSMGFLLLEFLCERGGARLELMLRGKFDLERPTSSEWNVRGAGESNMAAEPSMSIECSVSGISVGSEPPWDRGEAVPLSVPDRLGYFRASVGFFSRCRS